MPEFRKKSSSANNGASKNLTKRVHFSKTHSCEGIHFDQSKLLFEEKLHSAENYRRSFAQLLKNSRKFRRTKTQTMRSP